MKKTASLLITSFLLLLFISSCEKEKKYVNTGKDPAGDMRAKIEGQQWVASQAMAHRMLGLISIVGGADKKYISITLEDRGVGTYTLADTSFTVGSLLDSTQADLTSFGSNYTLQEEQVTGMVTISAIDASAKRIKGTFYFLARRGSDDATRNITEGSFDVSYATEISPNPNSTDTLQAKVAGSLWKAPVVTGLAFDYSGIKQIAITGSATQGFPSIGLFISPDAVPGTYDLDIFSSEYYAMYNASSTSAKASSSGKLIILEHNKSAKHIRGNFNFVASDIINTNDSTVITEGYFSVKYN